MGLPLPTRRSFFGILIGSISAVVGAMMAVPLTRFALSPIFRRSPQSDWCPIGAPADFAGPDPVRAEVEVHRTDGWRSSTVKQTVWACKDPSGGVRVLSSTCPHLGCVVSWSAQRQSFLCPCHKGVFGKNGELVSGPPPRGLDPLPTKIEEGRVWVRYQYYLPGS